MLVQNSGDFPLFTGIPAKDVPEAWGFAKPLIAKACKLSNGKYRANDFYQPLLKEEMQLWVHRPYAAALTTIINYPHKRICSVFACGGDGLREFAGDIRTIEAWAKAQGCDAMRIEGRAGWERILEGYSKTMIVLEKGL